MAVKMVVIDIKKSGADGETRTLTALTARS